MATTAPARRWAHLVRPHLARRRHPWRHPVLRPRRRDQGRRFWVRRVPLRAAAAHRVPSPASTRASSRSASRSSSLGRDGDEQVLVTGEYGKGGQTTRLATFEFDPVGAGVRLTDGQAHPLRLDLEGLEHMQGRDHRSTRPSTSRPAVAVRARLDVDPTAGREAGGAQGDADGRARGSQLLAPARPDLESARSIPANVSSMPCPERLSTDGSRRRGACSARTPTASIAASTSSES